MSLVDKAREFARAAHANQQRRDSGEPYKHVSVFGHAIAATAFPIRDMNCSLGSMTTADGVVRPATVIKAKFYVPKFVLFGQVPIGVGTVERTFTFKTTASWEESLQIITDSPEKKPDRSDAVHKSEQRDRSSAPRNFFRSGQTEEVNYSVGIKDAFFNRFLR